MQASDLIKPVELDGKTYNIAMCSALDQRAIMFRLAKYGLEPMLREISLSMLAQQTGAYKDTRLVALSIVGTMIARMPEDDFNLVCDKVLYKVQCDGQKVSISDFTGNMSNYNKLAVAALGVNFSDFTALLSLMMKSTGTDKKDQETEETSTPESTGS